MLAIRAPQGLLGADLLTVFTASHGGAEDSLILSIVECVAIPIHWMVETCEVPIGEGEYRSEKGRAGNSPHARELKSQWAVLMGQLSFVDSG